MQKLLIIGAGGHGKVVADTAALLGQWSEIAFLDDRCPDIKQVNTWSVIGKLAQAKQFLDVFSHAVVAIGDNQKRLQLSQEIQALGFILSTIIHPTAFIASNVNIGPGSVVFAQAAINIDARIGMAAIINTGAIVEHDCKLGAGVHISPSAALAGGVLVGDGSWIGLGASVVPKVTIGSQVIVGAGSVIIRDVPSKVTVVGVPARVVNNAKTN